MNFTRSKDVDEADIADKVRIFEEIVNSSLVQKLIRATTDKCKKCGANRLEVAIDYYLGKRKDICLRCRILLPLIKTVIGKGIATFGMSESELIELMQDSYWTKALVSVIKGLGEMGIQKPFIPSAPLQVQWDLRETTLSHDEIYKGIDKLASFGVAHITFIGNIDVSFIKYATGKGMYVCLENGVDKIDEYIKAGVKFVDISLDSINSKTGLIKKYNETDVYVEVSTKVTKENLLEIPQIIEFLKEIGVGWYKLDVVSSNLEANQRLELFKLIYMENINEDMQILTNDAQFGDIATNISCNGVNMIPTHFFNINYTNSSMKELGNYIGSCGAGRFYMAIDGNGDIMPCQYFQNLKIANINDDLEDVWLNNDILLKLRNKNLLKGKCGECESKYVCGGCRLRAYLNSEDILAQDLDCLKESFLNYK